MAKARSSPPSLPRSPPFIDFLASLIFWATVAAVSLRFAGATNGTASGTPSAQTISYTNVTTQDDVPEKWRGSVNVGGPTDDVTLSEDSIPFAVLGATSFICDFSKCDDKAELDFFFANNCVATASFQKMPPLVSLSSSKAGSVGRNPNVPAQTLSLSVTINEDKLNFPTESGSLPFDIGSSWPSEGDGASKRLFFDVRKKAGTSCVVVLKFEKGKLQFPTSGESAAESAGTGWWVWLLIVLAVLLCVAGVAIGGFFAHKKFFAKPKVAPKTDVEAAKAKTEVEALKTALPKENDDAKEVNTALPATAMKTGVAKDAAVPPTGQVETAVPAATAVKTAVSAKPAPKEPAVKKTKNA